MIDPGQLKNLRAGERRRFTAIDSRLYALGVGFGGDPLDAAELPFVGGTGELKVVPTMVTVFGGVILELTESCRLRRPELALHAEQRLEVFEELHAADEFEIEGRITEVYDRGEKGAVICMTAEGRRSTGQLAYRATYVTLARGDGGFGGRPPPRRDSPELRPAPAGSWDYATRADQALLYSLNGDPNPIHLDPVVAAMAGFSRPILHGLCTYGIACRGLLARNGYDAARLRRFDARFTAPVIPGETLVVDTWGSGPEFSFEVTARERDMVVLKDGCCHFAA